MSQSEHFIGEIKAFAGKTVPEGWLVCDGRSLEIVEPYTHLYSAIGTTYGGDGTITFNLPDLRGRLQMGSGIGPYLHARRRGETGGVEKVVLNATQLPQHSHALKALATAATAVRPERGMFANPAQSATLYFYGDGNDVNLAEPTLGPAGGVNAHNNMMPGLAVTYLIAYEGIVPPPAPARAPDHDDYEDAIRGGDAAGDETEG